MKSIFYGLILLFLIACGNNKENAPIQEGATVAGQVYTPVQLNERIMALESSLEEPMLKAEAEIKVRGDNGNLEGVIQSAKSMEDTLQLRINELKKLSPVGSGGSDFLLIATRYFEYLKSIYTNYRELADAKTDEAKKEQAKKMEDLIKAQPDVLTNLRTAQQKYATENGFVY